MEDRQRRLFAVEVEDDLGALPGHFNITVGGHRGELAQPRPASGRTSVALVPVAGYPLAQGAIERGRERLESRPQVVLCCCRSRRPARLGCMSGSKLSPPRCLTLVGTEGMVVFSVGSIGVGMLGLLLSRRGAASLAQTRRRSARAFNPSAAPASLTHALAF